MTRARPFGAAIVARAVALLLAGISWCQSDLASAQNAVTQPYILAFDACVKSGTAPPCSGPQYIYIAQSADGVAWQLVPGYTPVLGSVPGVVRRGNVIYIVAGGAEKGTSHGDPSTMETLRYHMDTGVWDSPIYFIVQDPQYTVDSRNQLQDPSVALDAQGRLVVIYDVNNYFNGFQECPGGVCHIRMATEVSGSDGTQFVAQASDAATYSVASGGDPSAPFFDGRQWVLSFAYSPPNAPYGSLVFVSPSFAGPYDLYAGLPNGVIGPGQMSGFFNPARGQYWHYFPTTSNQLFRAVKTSLSQTVTSSDLQSILTSSGIGLGANITLQHPHFATNWSGNQTVTAAIAPQFVSVPIGSTATATITLTNTENVTAADCFVAPRTALPATFSYQATNPATGAPIGAPNTPVPVNGNGGVQTFTISITPTAAIVATEVQFTTGCASTTNAMPISGLNTLLLTTTGPTSSQIDCLFNWAEGNYPSLFAPASATSATLAPYYYRYYSGTGNYLATSLVDNHLWSFGPVTGNTLFDVGPLSRFLDAAGCSQ